MKSIKKFIPVKQFYFEFTMEYLDDYDVSGPYVHCVDTQLPAEFRACSASLE